MDFKEIEKKWKEKWEEKKLFEPVVKGEKKFYITVAYPYPSGSMHIGHVRTYTVPDAIARFKRMQGFNVLFPMAWHVTGTPIIGAVNRLKKREKKQMHVLKNVFGVKESELKELETPMGYARYFIEKHYKSGMKSLGHSIDWSREFTTNDEHYKRFIEWQHGILFEKGLEKKGFHPVKWCLNDKNPVTTHDLLEGENADIQEFTLLKFKFEDKFLVAATLRPETVFGQTNVWVNPETEYIVADLGKEKWIISRECAEKLSHQGKEIKVTETVKGKELVGKSCVAPEIEKEIIILPSEFPDPDIGTGIVTSVPSDAPYDWIALKTIQEDEKLLETFGLDTETVKSIKPVPIIKTEELGDMAAEKICKEMGISSIKDKEKLEEATRIVYKKGFHKGVMNENCGKYAGMKVEKAKELIKNELVKQGKADVMYEFSEPVVCRCGGKVIVALHESWFIDYSNKEWKELAKKCLREMKNIPEATKNDFFHTIDWLNEWPCVRNYGLGTPLPQDKRFIIEPLSDSTIYMAFYTISHKIKNYSASQLKKEFFDYVMLGKGKENRVSNATGIPEKELKELRKEFLYWYPLDWRCSALELIQNHLTFMIFHHVAVFPEQHWPRGIAAWGMGLLEGGKMSSSKGNVVLASQAVSEFGADTARLFLLSSVEPWQDFDWKAKEVKNYQHRLESWFKKVLRLSSAGKKMQERRIDKWLLSEAQEIIKNTTEALEKLETRKAALECFFRMDEIIKWYEKRAETINKEVMDYVLETWIRLLTPFVPFICEELWEKTGHKGFVSLSSWPEFQKKFFDKNLGKAEELIKRTQEDTKEIVKLVGKKPKNIKIYTAPLWKYEIYADVLKNVKSNKEIIPLVMKSEHGKKYKEHALKFAQRLAKEFEGNEILSEEEEFEALKDAEKFFEKTFSCEVEVLHGTGQESEKARNAEPGKPGIEIIA
ncbi:MAG: leucine--tRNA ligase [Candidatus Aenigmatarchaeota archaeon]|nr:MAG: leucine--tRNA ligase [Candidatus Aenigmarchaeota archaeon]